MQSADWLLHHVSQLSGPKLTTPDLRFLDLTLLPTSITHPTSTGAFTPAFCGITLASRPLIDHQIRATRDQLHVYAPSRHPLKKSFSKNLPQDDRHQNPTGRQRYVPRSFRESLQSRAFEVKLAASDGARADSSLVIAWRVCGTHNHTDIPFGRQLKLTMSCCSFMAVGLWTAWRQSCRGQGTGRDRYRVQPW